ncbi:MAG: VWA domain-containing protein [Firmicutes bacterium]|nr:VWA domain-containing protein [Bacillota bacterium]
MKNKKTIIMVASIIAVITIIITCILLINTDKDKDSNKNKLNVINKRPNVILNDDGVAKYVGKDEVTTKVENKNDAIKVIEEVKDYFKIEKASDVLEIKKVQESGDFTFYKLNQKYSGVKVYGNELVVTVNKDKEVTSITGKYVPLDNVSTYSSISIDKTKETLNTFIKGNYEVVSQTKYIYIKDGTPIYCYVYSIMTNTEIFDLFINAKTGEKVDKIYTSYSSDYSYSGKGIFGENVTVSINEMALSGYQLHDNKRNISIVNATNVGADPDGLVDSLAFLTHMKLRQAPAVVDLCKDGGLSTDLCIHSNTNFIQNSLTGMNNFVKTYDFYNNILGRKSYDDKGSEIFVNIGFVSNLFGSKEYENASWYGGDIKVFGFGSMNNVSLAAGLDIVAHEYTHAVSGDIVGLTYQGESGALNEAYSDIMGSLIEGKNFQLGEDVGGFRDMTNPNRYSDPMVKGGKYYFPADTETYNEEWRTKLLSNNTDITDWTEWDNGGVHTNSGVPNYTAFLMYDNGAFTSKEEMAKVWYTSLYLLSSNADFEDCALAVIEVAKQYNLSEDKIKIIEEAFKTTKMLEVETGALSGVVTSKKNNKPLEGTVVTAISELNSHVYYQTTTDENGSYKIEDLPATSYLVTFEMPKHKDYEEKITIVNKETKNLDMKLEKIDESNYKEAEIVFVLDISSSMNDSDPTNIRKQIIHNVVSSLGSESKVALVTFTGTAKLINNGLSNKSVDKKILITDIFNMVNDSGYNSNSGTNGRAGLEEALKLFDKDSKTRKYIVFLTDGEDNKTSGPTYDEIIKQSKDMDLRILTIGLGRDDQLDEGILIKLASGTNGKYYHATKSSNLYEFDRRIFAELS